MAFSKFFRIIKKIWIPTIAASSGFYESLDKAFHDRNYIQNRLLSPCRENDRWYTRNGHELIPPEVQESHAVIEQAFRNAGFQGDVIIDNGMPGVRIMGVTNIGWFGTRTALVGVNPELTKNKDKKMIYSLAAHEAIHVKHRHELITTIISTYFYLKLPIFFGMKSFQSLNSIINKSINNRLIKLPLNFVTGIVAIYAILLAVEIAENLDINLRKITEVDADISASIQLGAADGIIKHLKDNPNPEKSSIHPLPETRIQYLSMIKRMYSLPEIPTLFQNPNPKAPSDQMNTETFGNETEHNTNLRK